MTRFASRLGVALLLLAGSAHAATIQIVNEDGPGEGFNDPTPVPQDGANPGTTRGAQRLALFQRAADVWAQTLVSNVTIKVGASFDTLTPCTSQGGVLGSAGPNGFLRDFTGAPVAATWYPIALVEAIQGTNRNGTSVEITAQFNSDVDTGCLGAGTRFWYGYTADGLNSTVDLFPVVLHELGHGLGFVSLACTKSAGCGTGQPLGSLANGFADVWTRFMRDEVSGKSWDQLTDAQRAASMTSDPNLTWAGPNVTAGIPTYQPGGAGLRNGRMRLHAPATIESGSSISHWSSAAASPNLLMEPALSAGVFSGTDLTVALFRDIGWTATGGGAAPANAAPVITRPASFTVTEDTAKSLAGVTVSDPDAQGANITMTLSVASGAINATSCTGVSVGGTAVSRTLTGSTANLSACFTGGAITYVPVANATTALTLTVVANDNGNAGTGGALTDSESIPLTFAAVNDGPTLTAPATLNVTAGVAATLALSFADIDAGNATMRLTLVANGSFSLPLCTGVTPSGTSTIRTFEGSLANLQACANAGSITYTAAGGTADTIQLTLSDLGNTGSGGALTSAKSIAVTITTPSVPVFVNGFE